MLNKAKSITTQTRSDDFMADSPVLLDPCNQLNQLQSQSQSQSQLLGQAPSQSLPFVPVLLMEECITALILPVSKDVHSLQCSMQSHMQQLQTAISQLSANVSFLLSAYFSSDRKLSVVNHANHVYCFCFRFVVVDAERLPIYVILY